jgi:HTH-type transcriptional regulator, SHP2-responsive activator
MDSRYGKVFKLLRNQKNLPLSYFEKIGVGKSHVGKFERGEIMMSFERVDSMLQLMNISLGEFEMIVNYYVPDFQNWFLLELVTAEFYQDQKKLKRLYKESKENGDLWLVIIAKARLEGLNNQEIFKVKEYLNNIKEWGYFDITLAFSVLDFLRESEIVQIIDELKIKKRKVYGEFKYRRRLYQLIYRSAMLLATKGNQKAAEKVLKLKDYFGSGSADFYISTLNLLANGVIDYLYIDKNKGKEKINEGLFMIERLGSVDFKNYHKKRILMLLKKEKL